MNVCGIHEATEIWSIVIKSRDDGTEHFLPPIDDMSCREFMAFPSRDEACRADAAQRDRGYIDDDEETRVVCLMPISAPANNG
jgi:hypothetical protein